MSNNGTVANSPQNGIGIVEHPIDLVFIIVSPGETGKATVGKEFAPIITGAGGFVEFVIIQVPCQIAMTRADSFQQSALVIDFGI